MEGTRIDARAYAKINLGLEVLRRREDGYHEIRTILQTIDFYDRLSFEKAPSGVQLTTDDPALDAGEENLVLRAARLLARETSCPLGATVHLEKRIPAGGGLGGGSADAAVTLLALNQLWGTGASIVELHRLAQKLGMDVPFFLHGGSAIAVGRGDEIYPLELSLDFPIVLILPDFSMSTADVYGNLRLTKRESSLTLQPFAWGVPLIREVGLGELVNDLEGAAGERFTSIQELKRLLREQGALSSMMSGSGSSVFGVFRDEDAAELAAHSLSLQGIRAMATRMLGRDAYRARRLTNVPADDDAR